jgi:asparagine synthase (glutamine-hydrolysing)
MLRLHRLNPRLLHPDLRDAAWDPHDPLPHPATLESCEDRLQRRLAIEFCGRLSDGILLETDKMSMAHSLETRMPFLHRPVVDFALALPSDLKLRRGQEKAILRRLVRDLPPEIAGRRKQGLWYPRDYTEHPSVRGYVRSLLLDSSTPSPILAERRVLEQQLDANLKSSAPLSGFLSVAIMQCWWNEFFGDSAGRGSAAA